jgi:ADP-ribosylation factor GTPase-activating protein 1
LDGHATQSHEGWRNAKCAAFLKQKGIDASVPIKQKYESPAAQLYKEILKARVEGRPEPTELPKAQNRSGGNSSAPSSAGFGTPKPGEDPNGMERLTGETDQQYIARQTRLRDEARQRMAAKFSGGGAMAGVGSSRMAGIGSDPNYNPNAGYSTDLNVDSLVAGFGSASSSIGSVAKGAAASASSLIKDEQIQSIGGSVGTLLRARSRPSLQHSHSRTEAMAWKNLTDRWHLSVPQLVPNTVDLVLITWWEAATEPTAFPWEVLPLRL